MLQLEGGPVENDVDLAFGYHEKPVLFSLDGDATPENAEFLFSECP